MGNGSARVACAWLSRSLAISRQEPQLEPQPVRMVSSARLAQPLWSRFADLVVGDPITDADVHGIGRVLAIRRGPGLIAPQTRIGVNSKR